MRRAARQYEVIGMPERASKVEGAHRYAKRRAEQDTRRAVRFAHLA